jgi:TatD DNase family protein
MRLASLDGLAVDVVATIGLHPHEASTSTRGLRELLDEPGADRVVAVGECGLDYYYEHSPRDRQLEALADQVGIAQDRGLALVLHVRDAFDDLFDVLGRTGVPARTVVHCFTGGPAEARRCLAAGMVVSVSGIVTFKNADDLRDAVVEVPAGQLMVETDSPFLAPVPHRGRSNEPAFVAVVGEAVAALRGEDHQALAAHTSATAAAVFGLGSPSSRT